MGENTKFTTYPHQDGEPRLWTDEDPAFREALTAHLSQEDRVRFGMAWDAVVMEDNPDVLDGERN